MALTSTTPDLTTPRGDSIDVQIQWPGADLTNGLIRATLKQKLDNADNDDAAMWKADLDPNNPVVSDDPTTGIANVHVDPGDETTPGTYAAKPDAIAYLDIEATLADPTVRKSYLVKVKFEQDGTRRTR